MAEEAKAEQQNDIVKERTIICLTVKRNHYENYLLLHFNLCTFLGFYYFYNFSTNMESSLNNL